MTVLGHTGGNMREGDLHVNGYYLQDLGSSSALTISFTEDTNWKHTTLFKQNKILSEKYSLTMTMHIALYNRKKIKIFD